MTRRLSICALILVFATLSAAHVAEAQAPAEGLAPPASVPAPTPPPQVGQPVVVAPVAPRYAPQPRYGASYGYGQQPYAPRGREIVGYRTEQQAPTSIWGAGLGCFLAGYVLDLILTPLANAISDDRPGAVEEDAMAWALLPVVGPIIQLAIGAPHPAIPITTGLLQLGGLTALIVGLVSQEDVRVPIYRGDEDDPNLQADLTLAPTVGGAAAGLTVTY